MGRRNQEDTRLRASISTLAGNFDSNSDQYLYLWWEMETVEASIHYRLFWQWFPRSVGKYLETSKVEYRLSKITTPGTIGLRSEGEIL